ncbi:unnamed protein product [Didymodactylos carnosus]|nr:unnamed protein product [Didymodactylos carnosus]CAF3686252.1 unnamed protein product [Didymodactylos carnosus]
MRNPKKGRLQVLLFLSCDHFSGFLTCGKKKMATGEEEQQETSSPTIDHQTTSLSSTSSTSSASSMSTPSSMVSDVNKTVWAKKDRQRLKRLGGGCDRGGYGRGGCGRGSAGRSDDGRSHRNQPG